MTVPGVGPKPAKIMFVAEAPGREEEEQGLPLVGASGRLFNQFLARVGISRPECYITNVLQVRPPNNDLDKFCVGKKDLPSTYLYSPVNKGRYLAPEFLPNLHRLAAEVRAVDPNVIVALGNLSCWALMSATGISKLRGAIAPCTLVPGKKVLPTYHPAYVLRSWGDNVVACADLKKAKAEAEFPEIRRPQRRIIIEPSLRDIENWIDANKNATHIAPDIETASMMITCIGFAASANEALVIPFRDLRQHDGCYWKTVEEELEAWRLVEQILCLPATKIFQNGLYDMQYLHMQGLRMRNCSADTMLLHHSRFPEMEKGLGFLGSLYSTEASWKLMHKRSKDEFEKKDE